MISIAEMMTSAAEYQKSTASSCKNVELAHRVFLENAKALRDHLFSKAMRGKGPMLARDISPLVGRNLCNTHRSLRILMAEKQVRREYPGYVWVGD